ncbi:MAG: motility protein A [Chloroflexota bacterium]
MDLATIIGLVAGILIFLNALTANGSLMTFYDWPSIQITLGGALFATMINFPMANFIGMGAVLKKVFISKSMNPSAVISTLVSFAEKARREGLLALEDDASKLEDPFLQKGLGLVVDGTDPELVRNILETELAFLEDRHKAGASLFEVLGTYAPAFGLVGTVIGLIQMLKQLDDPSTIGAGMATALITTFYGAILANFILLPMAGKLKIKSAEEILLREVMIEGILSIQAGDNPRIVEEKLKAFLAPKMRKSLRGGKRGKDAGPADDSEEAANG